MSMSRVKSFFKTTAAASLLSLFSFFSWGICDDVYGAPGTPGTQLSQGASATQPRPPSVVGGGAASPAGPASGGGALSPAQEYAKAKALVDRGEPKPAGKILLRLLQRFPDNLPSRILLAKVYYALNVPAKAAQIFAKIPLDSVPPEAVFEFGASMFAIGQCATAIAAFSKVPDQAPLRGVADFYVGVCDMRKRNWHQAGIFLRRAKNLPPTLALARRKLLQSLDDREREDRFGALNQQAPSAPLLPPAYYWVPPMAELPAAGVPEAKKAPKPKPKTGFGATITPGLLSTGAQKRENFHDTKTNNYTGSTIEETLGIALRYDGEPFSFGAQPNGVLNLNLGRYSAEAQIKSTKLSALDDDPSRVFVIETESNGGVAISSSDGVVSKVVGIGESWDVKVNPVFSFPITDTFDIEANYLYYELFPSLHQNSRAGRRGPGSKITLESDKLTLNLTASYLDSLNFEDTIVRNDLTLGGVMKYTGETKTFTGTFGLNKTSFPEDIKAPIPETTLNGSMALVRTWDSFSLTGTFTYIANTPFPDQLMPDPETIMKVDVGGKITVDFFSFSLTGSYADQSNLRLLGIGEAKTDAVAAGQVENFIVGTKFTPIDWLFFSVGFTQTLASYTVTEPLLDAAFKSGMVSSASLFTYAIGVSKAF